MITLALLLLCEQPIGQTVPEASSRPIQQLNGVVGSVDTETSRLTVRREGTAEPGVIVQARPFDLVNLEAGDAVSLHVRESGGQLWLVPAGGFAVDEDQTAFPDLAKLRGTITRVDAERGVVAVRGTELRAHPEQVRNLEPGQLVSLTFTDVGRERWVAEIERTGRSRNGARHEVIDERRARETERERGGMGGPRAGRERGNNFVPGVDG